MSELNNIVDPQKTKPLRLAAVNGAESFAIPDAGPLYNLHKTEDGKLVLFFFAEPEATRTLENRGAVDAVAFLKQVRMEVTHHYELVTASSDDETWGDVPYSVTLRAGDFVAHFPWQSREKDSPKTLAEIFLVRLARIIRKELLNGQIRNLGKVYTQLGVIRDFRSYSDIVRMQKKWQRWGNTIIQTATLEKQIPTTLEVRNATTQASPENAVLDESVQARIRQIAWLLQELGISPDILLIDEQGSRHSEVINTLLNKELSQLREFIDDEKLGEILAVMFVSVLTSFVALNSLIHNMPEFAYSIAPLLISVFGGLLLSQPVLYFDIKEKILLQQLLRSQQPTSTGITSTFMDQIQPQSWITPQNQAQIIASSLRLSLISEQIEKSYSKTKSRTAIALEIQNLLKAAESSILKPLFLALQIIDQNFSLVQQIETKQLEEIIVSVIAQLNQYLHSATGKHGYELLMEESNFAATNRQEFLLIAEVLKKMHTVLITKKKNTDVLLHITIEENGQIKRVELDSVVAKILTLQSSNLGTDHNLRQRLEHATATNVPSQSRFTVPQIQFRTSKK